MVKITFLGTSAQIPTLKRNHSAILLNYKEENILIDCGEGTQRQFRKLRLNLGKITKILITHIHGDHTFGLPGLISTLNFQEYNKTLKIYGPRGSKKYLEKLLDFEKTQRNFEIKLEEVTGNFFKNEDFYLEAMEMEHGIPTNAYNFIIKDKLRIDKTKMKALGILPGPSLRLLKDGKEINLKNKKIKPKDLAYLEKGKKISIVLDTAFTPKIAKFAKEANLFICESSFGSDLKNSAKDKFHLTSEEAGEIAKKAGVKKLVLTHISQRYETNKKLLLDDVKKNFKDVIIAKDFDSFEV